MEKGVGKPITLFSPSFPSRSLQCTEVGMRGGDVSIWMVWLRALSAITAMRGAAVHSANQRSRLDGLHRGFFVTVYLVRKGKKKKKSHSTVVIYKSEYPKCPGQDESEAN